MITPQLNVWSDLSSLFSHTVLTETFSGKRVIMENRKNRLLKLGLRLLKGEEDILKDDVKYTLVIGKIVLSLVHFWPENNDVYTKISFYGILFVYALIELSLFIYIFTGVKDIVALTGTMSTFSVGIQVIILHGILIVWSTLLYP